MDDKATIWVKTTNDGFGGVGWSAPVVVDSANALRQQKFTDANGDTKSSKAVFYTESVSAVVDARVLFGESAALSPPPEANDIRATSQIPRGSGDLRKAWLV